MIADPKLMARNIRLPKPTTKMTQLAMIHLNFSQASPLPQEGRGDCVGSFA